MRRRILLAAAAALFAAATPARADLIVNQIVNGGFEEDAAAAIGPSGAQLYYGGAPAPIVGWTVLGHSIDWLQNGNARNPNYLGVRAFQGRRSVDLNGLLPGGLRQRVRVVPNTPYTLSFELAPNPRYSGTTPRTLTVEVGDQQFTLSIPAAPADADAPAWTRHELTVVAAAAELSVGFVSTTGGPDAPPEVKSDLGPVIDDVQLLGLSAVPAPPAGLLAALGGALILVYRRLFRLRRLAMA